MAAHRSSLAQHTATAFTIGSLITALAAAPAHSARAVGKTLPANVSTTGNGYAFPTDWDHPGHLTRIYGNPTDHVLVGDFDGDGRDSIAVRRGNAIYVSNNLHSATADYVVHYGNPTDHIMVGDFNGNGTDTFAARRGNTVYVSDSLTPHYADYHVVFGDHSDRFLVGDFNGNGTDTLAVQRAHTIHITNDIRSARTDTHITLPAGTPALAAEFGNGHHSFVQAANGGAQVINPTTSRPTTTVAATAVSEATAVGDWTGTGQDTPLRRSVTSTADPNTSYANDLVRLINAQRRTHHLPHLRPGSDCAHRYAQTHADRLADGAAFAHQDLGPILTQCGFAVTGENLAWGVRGGNPIPATEMVANWMASPGHRANVLATTYHSVVSATARRADGGIVAVHIFAGDS